MLTDFPLARQAFRIRREETRKHNRQCQPPVRRAGPGSARLRHRQLRLQNDEAVKLPDARMAAAVLKSRVFPRQDSTKSFFLRFLSVCLCFPSLFFSLCLAGLSFLEREESLFEGF